MTRINELPKEVQSKIRNTLKVYDRCYVIYEYGRYNVSVGIALKAEYAADHKVIGEYTADEIFTEEERIENYINEFCDFPVNYKGKRDYSILRKMEQREWSEDRTSYRQWQGKIVDGTFQLTEMVTVNI